MPSRAPSEEGSDNFFEKSKKKKKDKEISKNKKGKKVHEVKT
jgi:hypothetical protein